MVIVSLLVPLVACQKPDDSIADDPLTKTVVSRTAPSAFLKYRLNDVVAAFGRAGFETGTVASVAPDKIRELVGVEAVNVVEAAVLEVEAADNTRATILIVTSPQTEPFVRKRVPEMGLIVMARDNVIVLLEEHALSAVQERVRASLAGLSAG